MLKVFHKMLLLVAVVTVTAHSVFPHFHFDELIAFVHADRPHHHDHSNSIHQHGTVPDNNDHKNNLFSFAQLDDEFIPVNGQFKKAQHSNLFVPAITDTFQPDSYFLNASTKFGWYTEYPPPDNDCCNLPLRAPPVVFLS